MDPFHITLLLLLGLAVVVIVWLVVGRARLTAERDVASARIHDAESMRTGFQAVAGDVLRTSNEEFLRLASERLAARESHMNVGMEKRRDAIDQLIKPLQKAVEETHQQLRRSEKDQAGLREHILSVGKSNLELRSETSKLVQALRKPNVRGRYGEVQLERVVELAGLRRYSDFTTQAQLTDSEGKLQKPDLIVRLPNGRIVAVDAKMPLDAYMEALEAPTEKECEALLDRYAQNFTRQLKRLAAKEYWDNFEDSPELVVMFVPGDQLVDAALERQPDLIDLAAKHNVVIASPSTLIGLLRAIHVGWRERNLSESAEELFTLGRELHRRAGIVIDHVSRVGDSLESARKNFNTLVGSVQSRLVPTLRRFEERDARSSRDIIEPRILTEETRLLPRMEGFTVEASDEEGSESNAIGESASESASESSTEPATEPTSTRGE